MIVSGATRSSLLFRNPIGNALRFRGGGLPAVHAGSNRMNV